ncbi:L-ribulose-5-phosphate 4-epimerase [Bacteroidota bacterium]
MLKNLKNNVFNANVDLVKYGLVIFTFGNVSSINRKQGLIVIKPSGVSYEKMSANDMVVVDMDGKTVEGILKPSSDTPAHLELYKRLPSVGSIVHTHSTWATIWAQAGKKIPCLGTTHADHFYGDIPCTRKLTQKEIQHNYEKNTGLVVSECYNETDPLKMPAVLVNNHGPFTFGNDANEAVYNAVVLEELAKTAYHTLHLDNKASIDKALLDKHYKRKHGSDSYYGQD